MKLETKSLDPGLSIPPALRAVTSQRDVPTTSRPEVRYWVSPQIRVCPGRFYEYLWPLD